MRQHLFSIVSNQERADAVTCLRLKRNTASSCFFLSSIFVWLFQVLWLEDISTFQKSAGYITREKLFFGQCPSDRNFLYKDLMPLSWSGWSEWTLNVECCKCCTFFSACGLSWSSFIQVLRARIFLLMFMVKHNICISTNRYFNQRG